MPTFTLFKCSEQNWDLSSNKGHIHPANYRRILVTACWQFVLTVDNFRTFIRLLLSKIFMASAKSAKVRSALSVLNNTSELRMREITESVSERSPSLTHSVGYGSKTFQLMHVWVRVIPNHWSIDSYLHRLACDFINQIHSKFFSTEKKKGN